MDIAKIETESFSGATQCNETGMAESGAGKTARAEKEGEPIWSS